MRDTFLLLMAVLLASYSNLMIKARATKLGGSGSDFITYLWSLALDFLFWTALAAFATATLLWLSTIRRVDLTIALPVMALTFVLGPLGAAYFLHEPLPPGRIAGLLLIVAGVFLVGRTA